MTARFNTLAEWLAWQESHHPSAIDLGLERVRIVAERLGVLSPKARVITIAGTNGKGSCVATLEALLSAAGKRFGAYTSPHFIRYNERVRLQGQPVTDAQLCDTFARIDEARGDISLTYFEFGTLAAMDIFNREPLDYWLLEVGLGGRLDAVNIVAPNVAVITSVAIDHEAWLGSTREVIGAEKAGICRANAPLVCADSAPPESVRNQVEQLGCPALWWGKDFGVKDNTLWTSAGLKLSTAEVHLPLPSVAAAIQVCELEGCLPQAQLVNVIEAVQLTGRMQLLPAGNLSLLLDVAHNPASAEMLAAELKRRSFKPMPAIIAVMADKDLKGVLAPLIPWVSHWHCVLLSDNPRAAQPDAVATVLQQLQVSDKAITVGGTMASAIDDLQQQDFAAQQALVFGSFFTVAEALSYCEG